mgnify:CR=1 FL=1
MENAYRILYLIVLICLGAGILFALIRAVKGPRTADRIMGINMIGTLSLLSIAVIALLFRESWLLDVSLIYGMISFLAVVVLTRVHMGRGRTDAPEKESDDE